MESHEHSIHIYKIRTMILKQGTAAADLHLCRQSIANFFLSASEELLLSIAAASDKCKPVLCWKEDFYWTCSLLVNSEICTSDLKPNLAFNNTGAIAVENAMLFAKLQRTPKFPCRAEIRFTWIVPEQAYSKTGPSLNPEDCALISCWLLQISTMGGGSLQ